MPTASTFGAAGAGAELVPDAPELPELPLLLLLLLVLLVLPLLDELLGAGVGSLEAHAATSIAEIRARTGEE